MSLDSLYNCLSDLLGSIVITVDSGPQNSILELFLRGFAPSNRIDEYEPYEVLKVLVK